MLASIIIRTYNEQRYLGELLQAINEQSSEVVDHEVVIVDSGSTDQTLAIAESASVRVVHMRKDEFTFGRSLNLGCDAANGDILVFVSGHCIPASRTWLDELCKPLVESKVSYTYGRQLGRDTTKFSEKIHFEKFFPNYSKVPQQGFFCNNANAALSREAFDLFRFNEGLTGLEDMYLAKLLLEAGHSIGYIASAPVFHIHDEDWRQVRIRYEREAYALQQIMPEVHFLLADFCRFCVAGILGDLSRTIEEKRFLPELLSIVLFRVNQYWGTYQGSKELRKVSKRRKHDYFYPKDLEQVHYNDENHSAPANESAQRTR